MVNNNFRNGHRCGCGSQRGPSSFHMQSPNLVFEKLALTQGDVLLDLGCGAGDYSFHASEIVGESGCIYALDFVPEMVNKIYEDAMAEGLYNIIPVVSDIRKKINLTDSSMDICLISTVLHMMNFELETDVLFSEVKRVLRNDGKLAIIECKKEKSSFGPSIHVRIAPEELEKKLKQFGFSKVEYIDLGSNYMMIFVLKQ